MATLMSILNHPVAFVIGLFLLLAGVWLLRKSGVAVLVCLACGVSAAFVQFLIENDWLPDGFLYRCAVYGVLIGAAILLSKKPVIARNAELVSVLALCFFAGRDVSDWLLWPVVLVWAVSVTGALLSPVLVISVFAASLLSYAIGAESVWATSSVFVLCLLVTRLQHGSWTRGYWDPQLLRDLRACETTGISAAETPNLVQVVFRCASENTQREVIADLDKLGIRCEKFPGGLAGAEVPSQIVRRWKQSWRGFFQSQPEFVYSGRSTVEVPPISISTTAAGMSLDQIAQRLRSHDGESLSPNVATGSGVVVAVLDTGINGVTSALKRALKRSVSFVPHEQDPSDRRGHGTPVGACILAIAPDVKLISVKVLDGNGRGTLFSVLRGLQYVAEHRNEIDIANLSLGTPCGGDNHCPLCKAMEALAKLGVPSCCAIGNSGPARNTVECPGASAGTIGVAAVDCDGRVAAFSSRGPCKDATVKKPDLANFGVNIEMPNHHGDMIVASGTSFACPLTLGVMAACMELSKKKASVSALYQLLRQSCLRPAVGSRDPHATGDGIVNLKRAAESLGVRAAVSRIRVRMPTRFAWQTAAVAAGILLTLGIWWFAVDHIGSVSNDLRATD